MPPNPTDARTSNATEPWFQDGVRFTCLSGCRRCCGGAPGDVWVTEEEVAAIAKLLRRTVDDFERTFVRRYRDGRKTLKERANYDCVLLGEEGCTVYAARPRQCRDYPFWPEVMRSPLSWVREMSRCPGIGEGGLHEAPKIADLLRQQGVNI
ncbi:MAG: YkgJ family cysteine cluster protein [Planctomycetes bacterium]|nr:YkgJ family cysteine cluster protein [Planctomycetota bacterium]